MTRTETHEWTANGDLIFLITLKRLIAMFSTWLEISRPRAERFWYNRKHLAPVKILAAQSAVCSQSKDNVDALCPPAPALMPPLTSMNSCKVWYSCTSMHPGWPWCPGWIDMNQVNLGTSNYFSSNISNLVSQWITWLNTTMIKHQTVTRLSKRQKQHTSQSSFK